MDSRKPHDSNVRKGRADLVERGLERDSYAALLALVQPASRSPRRRPGYLIRGPALPSWPRSNWSDSD